MKLALRGGQKVHKTGWPKWPIFGAKEEKALLDALHTGIWGIGGKKNEEFARKFADYQQVKYAITCSNGTAALELALRSLGIGFGDEVITSSYTFMATAQVILYVGARPIFVDIEEDTYNIDPSKTEETITSQTKAIMPVHIGGAPARIDEISEIAKRHGLYVIEDCAQAHGARWNGKGVGSFGDYGAFSFQSSKNISCGEGGAVTAEDEALAERAWSYMNCGRIRARDRYHHEVLGGDYRLSEFNAAVLIAQLSRAERQFKVREKNATYLRKRLDEIEGIECLNYPSKARSAFHIFIFKYKRESFDDITRERFLEAVRAEGIPAYSGYIPLYRMPAFINLRLPQADTFGDYCNRLHLPVTERACYEESVWLGQNIMLASRRDLDDIADAILKVKKNLSELT